LFLHHGREEILDIPEEKALNTVRLSVVVAIAF
jgi:hypothetical protein